MKFPFALAEFLDDRSGEFFRNIDVGDLHRLQFTAALVFMVEDFCFADREFITFPAHIFNQDRQMKFSTSRYFKALGRVSLFHTETDVCVQFPHQTVPDVAGGHVFSFLSGQGTVIYHEIHGDCRLGDLLEGDRICMFRIADGVSDMQVCDT